MNQETIEKAVALIKRHEGLRLKPYRCPAGKLTIGYGRNLDDKGISIKAAEFLLTEDINEAISNLRRVFLDFDSFTEQRQCALIDMMFNLGMGGFMAFARMIAAIGDGEWDLAAEECLNSKYAQQVGPRAVEIAKMLKSEVTS